MQGDDRIIAWARRGDESARHRCDERMAPAVVGVLAEDLEPPRHPERVFGRAASHALERFEDEVEEDPLAEGLGVAEADGGRKGATRGNGEVLGIGGSGDRSSRSPASSGGLRTL